MEFEPADLAATRTDAIDAIDECKQRLTMGESYPGANLDRAIRIAGIRANVALSGELALIRKILQEQGGG